MFNTLISQQGKCYQFDVYARKALEKILVINCHGVFYFSSCKSLITVAKNRAASPPVTAR